MHHTNFQTNGITWPGNVHELSVDRNFTTIWVNQAVENVHQSSFACAILTHQCMNLSFTHLEINMIVGNDTGPGFGDVTHLHSKWSGLLLSWSLKRTFLHR